MTGDGDSTEQNEPLLSSLDDSFTVLGTSESEMKENTSIINVNDDLDESIKPLLSEYEVIYCFPKAYTFTFSLLSNDKSFNTVLLFPYYIKLVFLFFHRLSITSPIQTALLTK